MMGVSCAVPIISPTAVLLPTPAPLFARKLRPRGLFAGELAGHAISAINCERNATDKIRVRIALVRALYPPGGGLPFPGVDERATCVSS